MMWLFIQNQILGMQWLNGLVTDGLIWAGVDIESRLGGSLQFFLYDVIKITLLLCVLIFAISYIQSFFPPERSRKIMGRFHGIGANIMGALLGTVTPFCSCSSIPLFMGFTSAGLPLGVTFSFLISSPMVDLGSLVLLISIFGYKIAAAYVVFGLIIAVIGGSVIERMHLENEVEDFIRQAVAGPDIEPAELTVRDRLSFAKDQMTGTFKKVFPYILIGVGIGALIHNWIPETMVETVLGSQNQWGVILATLVGVPMYADIFFWNYSHCRSTAGKRGSSRCCPQFHDGRDDTQPAVPDFTAQGRKAKIAGRLCSHLCSGNHSGRIRFQCSTICIIVRW